MPPVLKSTTTFISNAISIFARLLSSRRPKSFHDLPDDVLIEVFTCLDFPSIISLRRTCQRCYRVSKTAAVWMDAFRWITDGAEDWRAVWTDSISSRSAQELELLVTRMVCFEHNWTACPPKPMRVSFFQPPSGYTRAFIPGGRWFLCSTRDDTGRLLYYDLNDHDLQPRTLIQHEGQAYNVWAVAFSADPTSSGTKFDLAVEFGTRDQLFGSFDSDLPRDMKIWRVVYNSDGELSASLLREFPVFRRGPVQTTLSLAGESLLRLSCGEPRHPVFTIHRWNGSSEDSIQSFILIPQKGDFPTCGIALLPDSRILAAFPDRVELYPSTERAWQDSPSVPNDIPPVAPQWVFHYKPPAHRVQRDSLTPIHVFKQLSAVFSMQNGTTLFRIRIALDSISVPEVTVVELGQMGRLDYLGTGTARAIRNTLHQKDAVFLNFPSDNALPTLLSFAGVTCQGKTVMNLEGQFVAPFPSAAGSWKLDEWSGRVLCSLELDRYREQCAVLYFAD